MLLDSCINVWVNEFWSLVEILGIFVGFGADFGVLGLFSAVLAKFWAERSAGRAGRARQLAPGAPAGAVFGLFLGF